MRGSASWRTSALSVPTGQRRQISDLASGARTGEARRLLRRAIPRRTVFAGVRLLDADKDKAIQELIPGIKTYKWSSNGTGEVMGVRHAGDLKWSQMPPRRMAYWELSTRLFRANR